MSARIVLLGTGAAAPISAGQGELLAAAISAAHVLAPAGGAEMEAILGAATDGFVLEGYPLNVAQAERLDAFLDARAASVEVVLWFRADAAPTPAEDALLTHYRHRVVEVDAGAVASDEQLQARALDAVREATLTLVG